MLGSQELPIGYISNTNKVYLWSNNIAKSTWKEFENVLKSSLIKFLQVKLQTSYMLPFETEWFPVEIMSMESVIGYMHSFFFHVRWGFRAHVRRLITIPWTSLGIRVSNFYTKHCMWQHSCCCLHFVNLVHSLYSLFTLTIFTLDCNMFISKSLEYCHYSIPHILCKRCLTFGPIDHIWSLTTFIKSLSFFLS